MFPITTGNPFMVQQSVSGTGVFDGSEYGRAKGVITNADPNAIVRVSARLYGAAPNAYTIQFVDAGAGVTVPATTVTQVGAAITVNLRRDSIGGLLATAAEVAAAINAAHVGLVAVYNGTGNGVVAAYGPAAANNSALGVDPAIRGANNEQYLYFVPANTSAGFFFFEQEETITVRQFEALFTVPGGTYTVTVYRVNLNSNYEPILSEAIPVFVWDGITTTRPDIAFSDVGIILHPAQALRVVVNGGGLPGVVRFDVRKGGRYPYL